MGPSVARYAGRPGKVSPLPPLDRTPNDGRGPRRAPGGMCAGMDGAEPAGRLPGGRRVSDDRACGVFNAEPLEAASNDPLTQSRHCAIFIRDGIGLV